MITECSLCRLNYCNDLAEDKRYHNKIHKRFENAIAANCYLLSEQEEILRIEEADELTRSNYLDLQVRGWQFRLEYYYNRSFRRAIKSNFWKKHPDYEEYMAMVNQHFPHIPNEVREELKKIYGSKEGEIEAGFSYWQPVSKTAVV